MVKVETRWPYTLPTLPLISSAISGFFFWGIMLEPVEQESSISTKPNSQDDHRISSSQKRDISIIIIELAANSSIQKSLSETESILFCVIPSKPTSWAV